MLFLLDVSDRRGAVTRPFFGSRRTWDWLQDEGYSVDRKRVQRLMREMLSTALYPKTSSSRPAKGQKVYPYRLKGLATGQPNQVWASDIRYVPMAKRFAYLVAIMG
jgi:putative transposase